MGADIGYLELVALFHRCIIGVLGEYEGQYSEIDEVGGVNALEGLGDDGPYAEGGRADRRVLSRGALAVGEAGDDDVVLSRVARGAALAAKPGSTPSNTKAE